MIHGTALHQHAISVHSIVPLIVPAAFQGKVIHLKYPPWFIRHRPGIVLCQQVIQPVGGFRGPKVPRHGLLLLVLQRGHQRRMLPRDHQVHKGRPAFTPIHIQSVSRAWRWPASIKDPRPPQGPQRHQAVPQGLNQLPLDQCLHAHITSAG